MELFDITAAVAGTWEADSDWFEQQTEVIIQEDIGGVEVVVEQEDNLVEDQDTLVTCRVEGGQPRPQIGFMLMEDQQNKIEVSIKLYQVICIILMLTMTTHFLTEACRLVEPSHFYIAIDINDKTVI